MLIEGKGEVTMGSIHKKPGELISAIKAINSSKKPSDIWNRLTVLLRIKNSHTPMSPRGFLNPKEEIKAVQQKYNFRDLTNNNFGVKSGVIRDAELEAARLMCLDPEIRLIILNSGSSIIAPTSSELKTWEIYSKSRQLIKHLFSSPTTISLVKTNPHFLYILERFSDGYSFKNLSDEFGILNFNGERLRKMNVNMTSLILEGTKSESFHVFSRAVVLARIARDGLDWFNKPIYPFISKMAKTILAIPPKDTDDHKYWTLLQSFIRLIPIIHYTIEPTSIPNSVYGKKGIPQTINLDKYFGYTTDRDLPLALPFKYICEASIGRDSIADELEDRFLELRIPIPRSSLNTYISKGLRLIENIALMGQKNHDKTSILQQLSLSHFNELTELTDNMSKFSKNN